MSRILYVVFALPLAGLAAAGGYWYARSHPHETPAAPAPTTPAAASASPAPPERKILYWYDPMVPQQRFDKPGKSPFMDMQLVPKYADEGGGEGVVSIDPRVVQNLGVRTAEARPGSLAPKLAAVGNVDWNERSVVLVQPRTAGFVERLHVRAALDPVRAGDPLVEILFPEWAGAQAEYLALRRLEGNDVEPLQRAARERLVLLGMSEGEIAAVERDGAVRPRVTLRAPVSGVVAELGAREGMTVSAGTTLFRIAGLGTVWVVAEVPEAQAGMLVPGERAEVRVPAYPDETFAGRVAAILPEVNAATRTVRARIEVANPAGKLKPGMYATLALAPRARAGLLVPSEAVIRTGERSVVIRAESGGKFRAVEVEVGMESGGDAEIRKGLEPGDKVVVSGQFLIDSEANLRATLGRLEGAGAAAGTGGAAAATEPIHRAEGRIVSADDRFLLIQHGPVPSAGMGAMTMEFAAPKSGLPPGVKAGDRVRFEFTMKDGEFRTTRVEPLK
jgi:Cu(I)/Ag(I) efflux system membrane fusion protein